MQLSNIITPMPTKGKSKLQQQHLSVMTQQQQQQKGRSNNNNDKISIINWRTIYANPEGYAAFDGGSRKGGYLIRGLCNTLLSKQDTFNSSNDFDNIINEVRFKVNKKAHNGMNTQIVEDVNQLNFSIRLKPRTRI